MTLIEVLERLEPMQRRAVALVYFEGRSPSDAARVLAVEAGVMAAALSVADRRISRWEMCGSDESTTNFGRTSVSPRYGTAEARPARLAQERSVDGAPL